MNSRSLSLLSLLAGGILLSSCGRPNTSSDQTLGGAALGAAWGAGSGAIVGNQVSATGEGAAIGAGFGLVAGAATGFSNDVTEDAQAELESELQVLKVQNMVNRRQLESLQQDLDTAASTSQVTGGIHQIFFDDDETSLKAGAISNLQVIADSLRSSPYAFRIKVIGHADDSGTPDYNQRLSEARARNVSSYLMARGISSERIAIESKGSTFPIASNSTPTGRQLNRRVDIFIAR